MNTIFCGQSIGTLIDFEAIFTHVLDGWGTRINVSRWESGPEKTLLKI